MTPKRGGSAAAKSAALARARRATRVAVSARERRDEAICAAAGHASYREIAEAVGLSKSRVQTIIGEQRA